MIEERFTLMWYFGYSHFVDLVIIERELESREFNMYLVAWILFVMTGWGGETRIIGLGFLVMSRHRSWELVVLVAWKI